MPLLPALLGALAVVSLPVRPAADERLSLVWRNAKNERLRASLHALITSRPTSPEITAAADRSRFRIEVGGAERPGSVKLSLVSIDPKTGRVRDRIHLRAADLVVTGDIVRTPWLVLVANREARDTDGLSGRALVAALGDWVEVRVRVGGSRARRWTMPVGRPSYETGPMAVRPVRLAVTVVQTGLDGRPSFGGESFGAEQLIDEQVRGANEMFSPCAIAVRLPDTAPVRVHPGPDSSLITFGERLGGLSKGGQVRLRVDGERLGPWKIGSEYTPAQTARLLWRYLTAAGLRVDRFENAKISGHTHASVDLLIRRTDGALSRVEPWPGEPLSTDPAQSLAIGRLTLEDGIAAHDDTRADIGTLEERTLIRTLSDSDSGTVDVFVVSRFDAPARRGTAFIPSGGVSDSGAIILAAEALSETRHPHTLGRALGRVLLDDTGQPEGIGIEDDRPVPFSDDRCARMRATIEDRFYDRNAETAGSSRKRLLLTPPPWRR